MTTPLPFALTVPQTWTTAPFGRVVDRSQQSGQPEARSLSVFLEQGVVPRDARDDNFNRLGADLGKYLVVRKGDIVFNKLRTWQGGLGASRFDGIVSPAYFVCRPRPTTEPRYLHYLLRSRVYLEELTRISKWMPPSQFDISWDDLRSLAIPLPPLTIQRAIAKYLDRETGRIDALIAAKRQMMELLEARWEVFVRECLLKPVSGATPPMLALKRRWRIYDCKHRTPTYQEEGFPVVSPGDVTPGRLDLSRCNRFVDATDLADLTAGRTPKRGDIIYSRNASIGIAAYVDTDAQFTMGQDVCLITSTDQSQRFLTYALNSLGLDQLDEQKIGSTFSRINIAQIGHVAVPCPRFSVQEAIANHLDAERERIDRTLAALSTQVKALQERRQALVTAAVTGQLDIPEAA